MKKFQYFIPVLPENQKYWFVRTSAGEYYEEFSNEKFIGIGWNKINGESLRSNVPLKDIVASCYAEENRPQHAANQITLFFNEMKKGDIVLIPSAKSTYINFGIIEEDVYEEDIPIELEEIDEHTDLMFEYEGMCPYRKRRKVNWIKAIRRDHLDPKLYRLIYSQHTISKANDYAEFIDRALYDFYIKGDECHMVMHVRKQGNIKGDYLVEFMYDLLNVAKSNRQTDDEEVDMKVSVQSPGVIEIIGSVPVIVLSSLAILAVIGGKGKVFGLHLDTPGIWGRILEGKRIKARLPEETQPTAEAVEGEPSSQTTPKEVPQAQQERLLLNAENLNAAVPTELQKAYEHFIQQLENQEKK
ncbi:hypothetical protein IUK39_03765 [Priestia aryabhattai]|uniref:hypothetical protein n=1 Tax=Priestia aryabhattai TaxID=412384 RepID=UPI001C0CFA98|nr:hypothetical protein [Priestia aryabhattai]MBU3569295.1 hypothetical protein [Priestia aryabhattai]